MKAIELSRLQWEIRRPMRGSARRTLNILLGEAKKKGFFEGYRFAMGLSEGKAVNALLEKKHRLYTKRQNALRTKLLNEKLARS